MKKIDDIYKYIALSFFAALFIILFSVLDASDDVSENVNDKVFFGSIFILSCFFGISLTLKPGWFKRILNNKNNFSKQSIALGKKIKRKGHHPDCVNFSSHTLNFRNKILCSGCFGLLIGSLISIFLMIFYMFSSFNIRLPFFYILLIIGFVIIGFVYLEILFIKRKVIVHILSNILLVISFFLITIGVFGITNNVYYTITSIILSFLWLDTRIFLSNRKHMHICANCFKDCKMY